jgi:Mrp family chromosome partitioning ATPase
MQLSRPNLFLISGGTSEDGEPAQIASDRMRLRVAELRQEFDFVLIDASAMSLGNDAIALSAMADGAVLVLKANTSRRELARKAVQDLQAGNAKVLGAVLNRRTFPIPNAIYKRL